MTILWRWVSCPFMFCDAQCGESAPGRSRFYLPVHQSAPVICARLLATPLRTVPRYRYFGAKSKQPTGNRRSHSGPWLASWLGSGSPTTPPNQSTIRHLNQKPPSHMTEQLRPPETLCSLPLPPIPHMNFILPLKNALHFASRCRPALARHIFTRHRLPRQIDESTISNDARCGLAMQVPR